MEIFYDKVWKNPVTGNLHFEVHPCGAKEILVDPLPKGAKHEGSLYPDGAVISDLKEVRNLLYRMQRPAISPSVGFCFQPFFSLFFNMSHSSSTRMTGECYLTPYCEVDYSLISDCRRENDLVLFHNRGVLHTVVGAFRPDQVRAFHQCNLAASDEPQGPSAEDIQKYT